MFSVDRMERLLHFKELLIFYDGAQLFVGNDQLGVNFLCVLEEIDEVGETYLCVPISEDRLTSFYKGYIDLRDIYIFPETDELFVIETEGEFSVPSVLKAISIENVAENWLPDPGFYYLKENDLVGNKGDLVIRSKEEQKALINLSLSESKLGGGSRINVNHLAEGLALYQTIVKRAYFKAKSELGKLEHDVEVFIGAEKQYNLEAVATGPGSFTIYLQSNAPSDLLGYVDIAKALEKIDDLTESLNNPITAVNVMKQNKGHLAKAYLRLLKFIVENEIPIKYEWAIPAFHEPKSFTIPRKRASDAYNLLIKEKELDLEIVELVGRLTKVDSRRKTWALFSETEKKTYHGLISKNTNISLSGLVIDSVLYKLVCEEKIKEVTGTGEEHTDLFLLRYEIVR